MSKASDLTFIRTQADSLAWAAIAARSLVTMGVISYDTAMVMQDAAWEVIERAREDPKFIGGTLPTEFKGER